MVRREVPGIVGLSLVIGLVAMVLLVQSRPGKDINLISSIIPGRIDRSVGSRPVFSIGLVVGRAMEELELSFSVMSESDPEAWLANPDSWLDEDDLRPEYTGLVPIDLWLETARYHGAEIVPEEGSAAVNGTTFDAYVYDFRHLSGRNGSRDLFAVLFENGNLSKVYWGYGDFFVQPEETIVSLKIDHGQESEVYSADPRGQELPIGELPAKGMVNLGGVSPDDQFLVTMVLEGHVIPVEKSWLWTSSARVDGAFAGIWVLSSL